MGKPFSLMKYTDLVRVYKQLEATMSNLEKTDILAEAFKDASDDDLATDGGEASEASRASSGSDGGETDG